MRGKSMVPYLRKDAPSIHEQDFIQGWETCGRAAVRKGDWKIVFIPKPRGRSAGRLYNLARDPGEIHDLSEQEPERLKELIKLWDEYVLETGVIPLAPELGSWMAAMEEQMPENAWIEYEYWKEGQETILLVLPRRYPGLQGKSRLSRAGENVKKSRISKSRIVFIQT